MITRELLIDSMINLAHVLRENDDVYYPLAQLLRDLDQYMYENDIKILDADRWF